MALPAPAERYPVGPGDRIMTKGEYHRELLILVKGFAVLVPDENEAGVWPQLQPPRVIDRSLAAPFASSPLLLR